MLHDFGKTGKELSVIQSGQCADIHVNQLRHVESAHHVFVAVEIHTGFPPMELSACASKVVGICTKSMPRR